MPVWCVVRLCDGQAQAAIRVKRVASLLLLIAGGHCLAQAGIGTAAREAEYDALIRSARDAGAEPALPRLDQLCDHRAHVSGGAAA